MVQIGLWHGETVTMNLQQESLASTRVVTVFVSFVAVMHLGNNKKGSVGSPPPPFGKRGPAAQSEGQRPKCKHQRREALLGGSGGMPPRENFGKKEPN